MNDVIVTCDWFGCCSERAASAGTSGERLKEGSSINKSLVTLGIVISTLGALFSLYIKQKGIKVNNVETVYCTTLLSKDTDFGKFSI